MYCAKVATKHMCNLYNRRQFVTLQRVLLFFSDETGQDLI